MSAASDNGRERLLRAGLDLFGRKGFAATSITNLCDHAAVSRGLIRFYFGSKQDLADEVENAAFAEMDRIVLERSERSQRKGLEASVRSGPPSYGSKLLSTYVRRALIEPTPRNLRFFKRLFALQREHVGKLAEGMTVAVNLDWLTMFKIFVDYGPLILGPQIEAIFGASIEVDYRNFIDTYWKLITSVVSDKHLSKVTSQFRSSEAATSSARQTRSKVKASR